MLARQEQDLTVLTEFLLIRREGGKLSEPEGRIRVGKKFSLYIYLFKMGFLNLVM